MKTKTILILAVLLLGIFLIGCGQKAQYDGYATYNQQQGQPQGGQYVGGGCGVAAETDYGVPSAGQASEF